MTNFDEKFNEPLPEDPDEISRGIDEVINQSARQLSPKETGRQTNSDQRMSVREIVDSDFSGGRMISSEVIHFWPTISEKNFLTIDPRSLRAFIRPILHYREDFEQRRDELLNTNNKDAILYYGTDNYQKMVDFQNNHVRRIMELSDPNQIRKYDKLVDEFNADRERILRERDYEGLQKYIAKVRALVIETK